MSDAAQMPVPIDGQPSEAQFAAAEENDVRQIEIDMAGGTAFDEHIFYRMAFKDKATGKLVYSAPHLSAMGVRALELVLSQRHELAIVSHSVELIKYDENDRSTWRYEAEVKMRNVTTHHDSLGAATRPFEPDRKLFNRRVALELARLKAMKGQLPLKDINNYLMEVTDNGNDQGKVRVFLGDGKGAAAPQDAPEPPARPRAAGPLLRRAADLAAQLEPDESKKEAARKDENDRNEGLTPRAVEVRIKYLEEQAK